MNRFDNPYPAKGPILWAVLLGLLALGTIPQMVNPRSDMVYVLFLVATVGAVALATKAVRDRR